MHTKDVEHSTKASIYEHVVAHIPADGPGLLPGGDVLPDDPSGDEDVLRLAPGLMDRILTRGTELSAEQIAPIFAERSKVEFILLGTGRTLVFPSAEVRAAFTAADIGLEPMDTGAAIRTYNILLGEGRPVGAALIAVT